MKFKICFLFLLGCFQVISLTSIYGEQKNFVVINSKGEWTNKPKKQISSQHCDHNSQKERENFGANNSMLSQHYNNDVPIQTDKKEGGEQWETWIFSSNRLHLLGVLAFIWIVVSFSAYGLYQIPDGYKMVQGLSIVLILLGFVLMLAMSVQNSGNSGMGVFFLCWICAFGLQGCRWGIELKWGGSEIVGAFLGGALGTFLFFLFLFIWTKQNEDVKH